MQLTIDNKKIACDTQLALKLVNTQDECMQLVHQLFNVTRVYNGRSYDEYKLKAINHDELKTLSKDELNRLVEILEEAFNEAYGCDIQGTTSCLQVLAFKD